MNARRCLEGAVVFDAVGGAGSEMLWIAHACRGGAVSSQWLSGGAIDSAEHVGDALDGAGRLEGAADCVWPLGLL